MKKILYIMHIDWDWIKQRPHFIAEELNKSFDVKVLYSYSKDRSKLKKNEKNGLSTIPYLRIPFRRNSKLFYILNNFILKLYFNIKIGRASCRERVS